MKVTREKKYEIDQEETKVAESDLVEFFDVHYKPLWGIFTDRK